MCIKGDIHSTDYRLRTSFTVTYLLMELFLLALLPLPRLAEPRQIL